MGRANEVNKVDVLLYFGGDPLTEEEDYLQEDVQVEHLRPVVDLEGEEPPLVVLALVVWSLIKVEGSHFEIPLFFGYDLPGIVLMSLPRHTRVPKPLVNRFLHFVDVRDVADALLLVHEKPKASGRYICSPNPSSAPDVVRTNRSKLNTLITGTNN
ncbi:hypothetical protein IEQ34_011844 [Dendrobium chrysotoxum]|uniref:Uncharacterized protein n=1 Tax=Dendrobium chrysotoxum TaxID=161865 RepID=A0AAV7GBA1_DENCH|nr:hypothetical protein IEQ34_011844 [Dendrobium chrysotoxum]